MTSRLLVKLFTVLAFIGMLFPGNSLAQQPKFPATIYTIQGKTIPVADFHLANGNPFYSAVRDGKEAKLPFEKIKAIQFVTPGKNYETDITFNDDKKDRYRLKNPGNIEIITKYSKVTLSHSKVSKIEFGALQKKQESEPVDKLGNIDRIILKNGDSLSGQLQTKVFTLKTSYGTFNFEASRIAYIDFDTKGKSVDVVMLKIGDRLSGAVDVKSVKFLLRSGGEANLESEAIKKIIIGQ
jgi:hypothetical protein